MPAYRGMETIAEDPDTARQGLRQKLADRYGIRGEYVGAAVVARILGVGLTTVYEQSKAGRFVIPHRLSNRKPLFLLDDLVDWMAGTVRQEPRTGPTHSPTPTAPGPIEPAHVFKRPEAEDAFLLLCAARGIKLPRARR